MPAVRTTEGALAADKAPGTASLFTQEAAEADCADRNKRAELLGIKCRYEVTEK